jgi:hypothetical protein
MNLQFLHLELPHVKMGDRESGFDQSFNSQDPSTLIRYVGNVMLDN